MFLLEPNRTPYDLRWRMFGVDIRVHPMFWLVSALLGWSSFQHHVLPGNGLLDLALWVLCCLLSITLHELGHVWMGQLFGSYGHIVLYSFGGLAVGSSNVPRRWQRIAVLAAGPGIQLLLWAALAALTTYRWSPLPLFNRTWDQPITPAELLVSMLLEVNLYWALLNLLPIYPLDGGQICREVCQGIVGSRGTVVSLWISLLVGAFLALHALAVSNNFIQHRIPYLPTGLYIAIMFGLLAFSSFQALQVENSRRRYWDDDSPWRS